jgi:hypothetical protein
MKYIIKKIVNIENECPFCLMGWVSSMEQYNGEIIDTETTQDIDSYYKSNTKDIDRIYYHGWNFCKHWLKKYDQKNLSIKYILTSSK